MTHNSRLTTVFLVALAVAACARREPPEATTLPGEGAAAGPAELTLRYRPPAGARIVCPAYLETQVSAIGPDRPVQQTLGGEREDVETVEAVDGAKRTVHRTFGKTEWTTAYPMPAPGTHDLPPSESQLTIDDRGAVESGTADDSLSVAMAAWIGQFQSSPGWPDGPLHVGADVPRPLRGPGPPGTGSTVEASAPLTLVGFARLGGRVCAKFRSDISGALVFPPAPGPTPGPPVRTVLHGAGWLYFDVETGVLLGSLTTLRYGMPLPGASRPVPTPQFRATFRTGPCTFAAAAP